MIIALRHPFPSLQLCEGVLEIGDGPLCLSYCSIVSSENLRVLCGHAQELGRLEHLALCLNALVDILDLLVELMRLISFIGLDHRRPCWRILTMIDQQALRPRWMRRSSMRMVRRRAVVWKRQALNSTDQLEGAVICVRLLVPPRLSPRSRRPM